VAVLEVWGATAPLHLALVKGFGPLLSSSTQRAIIREPVQSYVFI